MVEAVELRRGAMLRSAVTPAEVLREERDGAVLGDLRQPHGDDFFRHFIDPIRDIPGALPDGPSHTRQVSGLARTVRGPSMSATPGKVVVQGEARIRGERVLALQFIQARDPSWVGQPFFARYDETATWLDDLVPAFGEPHFFFERGSRTGSGARRLLAADRRLNGVGSTRQVSM